MKITKGTDVTELFESSHLNIEKAEKWFKDVPCSERKPGETQSFSDDF